MVNSSQKGYRAVASSVLKGQAKTATSKPQTTHILTEIVKCKIGMEWYEMCWPQERSHLRGVS